MRIFIIMFLALIFVQFSIADQIIQRHTVKKGETLSSLAQKYNTSVENLKNWNNIKKNTIHPGQVLIVGKHEAKTKTENVYIVKKGDSLYTISKKTGVPVEKIKDYNNLKSNSISPGQKLVLSKPEQKNEIAKKEVTQSTVSESKVYFVKKGDTLSSISKKSGVPIEKIKELNNLKSNKLSVGQKIVLKNEEIIVNVDNQQVVAVKTESEEKYEEDNVSAAQPQRIIINKYHTIRKGESLSTIAKKYKTTVASIKKLNNLKSNTIKPGKTIIVARITKEIIPPVINPTPIVSVSPKVYYNVKLGDTLESIAEKFGISVSALKETNLLSDGKLKIGQTLVIPQVADVNENLHQDTPISGNENPNQKLIVARIIENAMNFINTPYRLGGFSEKGIDCSGLVKKSYEAAGITLPRTSREQAKTGEIVPISAIKPGDLLFFGKKGRINHVGIYLGDNKFIHASRESGKVVIANLEEEYYQKHLICAKTIVNGEQAYWIEEESN